MPLIIADDDGTLVYKSLSVREREARELLAAVSAKENKGGVFRLENKRVVVKEMLVRGKKQVFFMDFDRLAKRFGDIAENETVLLLDSTFLERKEQREISLAALTRLFAENFALSLKARGVNISLRFMAKTARINVSVSALLLCLSLMVSAFCKKGATVYLGAEDVGGNIRFYAESDGGESSDMALVAPILCDAAAVQGFSLEFTDRSISLTLSPADISLYGFKSADYTYLEKICELCLELII